MAIAPLPEHAAAATPALAMGAISHQFGDLLAVDQVDLSIQPGEILALVGPSGCGKTTLLRLAAGLEEVQAGTVHLAGTQVGSKSMSVPPEQRAVGLMFQDFALFPHLTVAGNVAFGLEGAKAKQQEAIDRLLGQVRLAKYRDAYPHTLSGGQQQRVALARALAPAPRVMLMDEPFSGLDATLRAAVREETLKLLREVGTATMIVTHDPEEALHLGDRVAVMSEGRIVQMADPVDIYFRPENPFVANFFGDLNRMAGRVEGGAVATLLGAVPAGGQAEGAAIEVYIRPEAIQLAALSEGEGPVGTVVNSRFEGRTSMAELEVSGLEVEGGAGGAGGVSRASSMSPRLQVFLQGGLPPALGSQFRLVADLDQAMVFPASQNADQVG